MCCLTIYKTKDDKLVVTHNRDEQKSRQISANKVMPEIIDGRNVWMPKDAQSNGTWIATDGQMVGALLNGFKKNHIKKEVYKASRGSIIPCLFNMKSTEQFIENYNPEGYEPFTLIIIDKNMGMVEYGWDEQEIYIKNLDTDQSHIYSSATLYDEEVKNYRAQLFFNWLKNDCSENDIWYLHALNGNDHRHFLNVNYNNEICTVAMSQIVLGNHSVFNYHSLSANIMKETLYLPKKN